MGEGILGPPVGKGYSGKGTGNVWREGEEGHGRTAQRYQPGSDYPYSWG